MGKTIGSQMVQMVVDARRHTISSNNNVYHAWLVALTALTLMYAMYVIHWQILSWSMEFAIAKWDSIWSIEIV